MIELLTIFNLIGNSVFSNQTFMELIFTLINSLSTIVGSIIGGLIGGLIAFHISKYQIKKDREKSIATEQQTLLRHKKLIIDEIEDNNKFLTILEINNDPSTIQTIVSYSLSEEIFLKVHNYLEPDTFYSDISKYYKVLRRIKNDKSLLDIENKPDLNAEISYLLRLSTKLDC